MNKYGREMTSFNRTCSCAVTGNCWPSTLCRRAIVFNPGLLGVAAMSTEKESFVYSAKLAEQAERYDGEWERMLEASSNFV